MKRIRSFCPQAFYKTKCNQMSFCSTYTKFTVSKHFQHDFCSFRFLVPRIFTPPGSGLLNILPHVFCPECELLRAMTRMATEGDGLPNRSRGVGVLGWGDSFA